MTSSLGKKLGSVPRRELQEDDRPQEHKASGVRPRSAFQKELDEFSNTEEGRKLLDAEGEIEIDVVVEETAESIANVSSDLIDASLVEEVDKEESAIIPGRIIDVCEDTSIKVSAAVNDVPSSVPPSAIRVRLHTLVEPNIARAKLRNLNLDDDMDEFMDSNVLAATIDKRSKVRERNINLVNGRNGDKMSEDHGEYVNAWWDSQNAVERLWGQLNMGIMIVPRWQFEEDVKAILGEDISSILPATLKSKVQVKLLEQGCTPKDLDSIIARKPPSVRPTK